MSLRRHAVRGVKFRKPKSRAWYKNQLSRWERRAAKVDPENAPRRRATEGNGLN